MCVLHCLTYFLMLVNFPKLDALQSAYLCYFSAQQLYDLIVTLLSEEDQFSLLFMPFLKCQYHSPAVGKVGPVDWSKQEVCLCTGFHAFFASSLNSKRYRCGPVMWV